MPHSSPRWLRAWQQQIRARSPCAEGVIARRFRHGDGPGAVNHGARDELAERGPAHMKRSALTATQQEPVRFFQTIVCTNRNSLWNKSL